MSEEIEYYGTNTEEKTKLLFLSKKLADVSKDLGSLAEQDKQLVIERAEKLNTIGLIGLYNLLGEYME